MTAKDVDALMIGSGITIERDSDLNFYLRIRYLAEFDYQQKFECIEDVFYDSDCKEKKAFYRHRFNHTTKSESYVVQTDDCDLTPYNHCYIERVSSKEEFMGRREILRYTFDRVYSLQDKDICCDEVMIPVSYSVISRKVPISFDIQNVSALSDLINQYRFKPHSYPVYSKFMYVLQFMPSYKLYDSGYSITDPMTKVVPSTVEVLLKKSRGSVLKGIEAKYVYLTDIQISSFQTMMELDRNLEESYAVLREKREAFDAGILTVGYISDEDNGCDC